MCPTNSLHDDEKLDAFIYWHQKKSTEIKNELLWDKEVSHGARFLYVLGISFTTREAEQHPKFLWRGSKRLAKVMGVSEGRVSHYFKELVEKRWVTRLRRGAMKTSITIFHAIKGQEIPEKDLAEIEALVDREIEMWQWKQRVFNGGKDE